MLQLTADEVAILRSQSGISSAARGGAPLRALRLHRARRGEALCGVACPRAVHVSIEIVRAFARLRALLAGNVDLARKLAALAKRYDAQFKVVFDAIRELMAPPPTPRRPIGFRS
jgi:hypothetical protein